MTAWQPIETAPKDGTQILIWGYYGDVSVAKWNRYWYGMCDGSLSIDYMSDFGTEYKTLEPTHWMPLPEPPE